MTEKLFTRTALPTLDQEADFVQALRARSPQAWTALFDRHHDAVYRYVLARLGSRPDAEDLAADVFVAALRGIDSFHYRGRPVLAWLAMWRRACLPLPARVSGPGAGPR